MKFALIGVAGYIAPRHMKAIKETGGELIAALDKHDSVGILDSYFPDCDFFTEFELFERYCEKEKPDFVIVCSPNYLHDSHIRFGLRIGAKVICEKPLVLSPWNIPDGEIFPILQLRLHPEIIKLKEQKKIFPTVNLSYITPRGHWYHHSWKGDSNKSGGIITNIGIHFFDMLIWLYGKVVHQYVFESSRVQARGQLILQNAEVNWFLSIKGEKVQRSFYVDEEQIDFTDGFTDLHTKSYEEILAGRGFSTEDARPAIELCYKLRNSCAAFQA